MPRPRTPTEVLELRGSFKKDPQRQRPVGPKASGAIGDPPGHMAEAEAAIWHELVGNAPPNVLTSADRPTLELLSRLMAKFRADWLSGAEMAIMRNCLTDLGWTPASRSKIVPVKSDEPASPFAEFLAN